jgi:hypothetical protein
MNSGKILLVNLSKGELGEEVTAILGSMIISAIQLAALQRAEQLEGDRKPFYLYVDEAHSFISSFEQILSEARKYKLSLFLTHQYIDQLNEKVRNAIFGNVGTFISFRIGAEDARYVAKEFYPIFKEADLVNLPRFSMYLKLMIDGATSKPFSAITLPIEAQPFGLKDTIIEISRTKYGNARNEIKAEDSTILNDHIHTEHRKESTLFDT